MISENPLEFLEAKQFYKYCTETSKPQEKRLVSDNDMEMLYQRFKEDYQKHPEYIPTYAVHFATLTGMRVGEISALSWDCIMESYIIINKSEKYNRQTKEYYIDKTKNGKERIFPLTDEIKAVIYANGYLQTKTAGFMHQLYLLALKISVDRLESTRRGFMLFAEL